MKTLTADIWNMRPKVTLHRWTPPDDESYTFQVLTVHFWVLGQEQFVNAFCTNKDEYYEGLDPPAVIESVLQ